MKRKLNKFIFIDFNAQVNKKEKKITGNFDPNFPNSHTSVIETF